MRIEQTSSLQRLYSVLRLGRLRLPLVVFPKVTAVAGSKGPLSARTVNLASVCNSCPFVIAESQLCTAE